GRPGSGRAVPPRVTRSVDVPGRLVTLAQGWALPEGRTGGWTDGSEPESVPALDTVQPHIESAVLDLGRHVGVVGLPAAVGGRTRVEQPQPGLGAGVPRDVRVPEDQHVHVGETLRAPPLSPLGRPCLVNDREAHAGQVLTR